jgi:hypothetical protein
MKPRAIESLEPRRLLCVLHAPPTGAPKPVELRPDLVGSSANSGPAAGPPADIIWTNRGTAQNDSDGFNATFGSNANLARGVIDAVIAAYEQMLGSFNYADNSANFNLTLIMDGNHNGAWASLDATLGGKPKSGMIGMGKGGDGHGSGWFLDPTPTDDSEFTGNVVNAYSADAPEGSPANGKGDFFTVAAAEITHCMGLFGGAGIVPMWDNLITDTGIPDTAEGGGVGNFWVFRGPSIKHLLTGNNGGAGGNAFPGGVHGAGPGVPVTFQGDTYFGAQDQGNAVYEFSRRYMVNNTFALMFKDAYNYATVDPARWGTMYSVRDATTNHVLARGGRDNVGLSNDHISLSRVGATVFVSVDVGQDVPGTGALPGNGNLPAFVTQYDISQVSSIAITAGDGNDTIDIGANLGVPVSVDAGDGNDTVTFTGTIGADTITVNSTGVSGAAFNVTLLGGGGSVENIAVNGDIGNDTVHYNGSGVGFNTTVNGNASNDTLNVTGASGLNPIFNAGSGSSNTLNLISGNYTVAANLGAGGSVVTVNVTGGSMTLGSSQHLAGLSLANSGSAATLSAHGGRVIVTKSLAISGGAKLDLNDNEIIVDYTGPTPAAAIGDFIRSGRNDGFWTGGGLISTSAKNNPQGNTTLGLLESADFAFHNGGTFVTGESPDATAVLVKYTYYGDTDFNGFVDGDDYARADNGFNTGLGGWINGDFDFGGWVDGDDYALIDNAYSTQSGVL